MITVYGTYEGNGTIQLRGGFDMNLIEQKYGIGGVLRMRLTKPRSHKQLNYFHAWKQEVFDNLPENCPEMFRDSEHMRSYLLYQAGYARIMTLPLSDVTPAVLRVLRKMEDPSKDKYLWFQTKGETLYIFQPESIALDKMLHEEFNDFMRKAREIVTVHLAPDLDMDKLDRRAREGGP